MTIFINSSTSAGPGAISIILIIIMLFIGSLFIYQVLKSDKR